MATESLVTTCAYISLVLAGLGIIGNICNARLMTAIPMTHMTSSVFIFGLAMADIVIIVYETMDDIAYVLPGNHTENSLLFGGDVWRCRVGVFCYQAANMVAAWLLVALSAELNIALYHPKKKPNLYNKSRALYVTLTTCLITLAGTFPFMVIIEENEEPSDTDRCKSKYQLFYNLYSSFILRIIVDCLVPVCIIVGSNITSLIHLFNINTDDHRPGLPIAEESTKKKPAAASRVILALTFFFVITTLPLSILNVVNSIRHHKGYTEPLSPLFDDVNRICKVLFLCNFTLKFYIVLLSSKACRATLMSVFSCGYIPPPAQIEHEEGHPSGAPSPYQSSTSVWPPHADTRF